MEQVKCTGPAEAKALIHQVVATTQEKGGVQDVYCVACGGSRGCFYPMVYFFQQEAESFRCALYSSNEFVHAAPKALGEHSVVFLMSLSGGTPETVAAAKLAKERGATVVALCAKHGVPLEEAADFCAIYRIELDNIYSEVNQSVILNLAFEFLQQTEGYLYYNQAIDGIGKIDLMCEKATRQIRPRAVEWGEEMKDEPVIYTLASGPSAFVAYIQSICMFMEMEWVNSSSIHCGEFFHGPFEITDRNIPFMLFMSDGKTRPLDERALNFLRNYAQKFEVIDAKELGVNIMPDEVVEYFNPILHWVIGLEYAEGLAKAKKHPLMQRRYLGKVMY